MDNEQLDFKINEVSPGVYKIEVENFDSLVITEDICRNILYREAKKNSLMGMALVLKLADINHTAAINIRTLYHAYRELLETQNPASLKKVSAAILEQSSDLLSIECAKFIQNLLQKSVFNDSENLMSLLVPGIEKTLTMKLPKKLHEEQEVRLPEIIAKHLAFPDLIKFKENYYACFREAEFHVAYQDFGKIRILKGYFDENINHWSWENQGLIEKDGVDLRDPRFFIDHNSVLRVMIGGSIINDQDETVAMVPHVAKLTDEKWDLQVAKADPQANGPIGQWIWKVTWNPHDQKGYALSYGKNSSLSLLKTSDGFEFTKIADIFLESLTDLSEAVIHFDHNGSAIALIRTRKNGIIATANPDDDYHHWSMKLVPFRIGGPNFVWNYRNNSMWAGTRFFFLNADNTLDESTIIANMDKNSLTPVLRLKSLSDCSYPGIVLEENGSLSVIYYSTDENSKHCKIYIVKVVTE